MEKKGERCQQSSNILHKNILNSLNTKHKIKMCVMLFYHVEVSVKVFPTRPHPKQQYIEYSEKGKSIVSEHLKRTVQATPHLSCITYLHFSA